MYTITISSLSMQHMIADMYLQGCIWLKLETKIQSVEKDPEVLPSLVWQQ